MKFYNDVELSKFCLFCGAPLIDGEYCRYECGTKFNPQMEKSQLEYNRRSNICYEREIKQLMDKLLEYDVYGEPYWQQPDYDEDYEGETQMAKGKGTKKGGKKGGCSK